VWDHAIELLPGAPTTLPGRLLPLTQSEIDKASNFVKEHLTRNTIQPSWSPYAANFFVKKKDGKLQPVQDYRPLNKWTKRNRNISLLIPSVIDRLAGCILFTKVDVHWGYNNIRIKPGDKWKAAFLTPEGLFEPTVMFFGLTNSPATFQMMMNTIFRPEVATGHTSVYMDDIIIHTKRQKDETEEQHLRRHRKLVHNMLDELEANNLYLKPKKCAFEQDKIEYLGVIVGKGHLHMDPKKLKGVADYPVPKNPTDVRAFLGLCSYYHYFIPHFSHIVQPLLELTRKTEAWHWNELQHKAFEELKSKMCTTPVFRQPNFKKKFYLQTDVSAYGVGAVLSQEGDIPTTSALAKRQKPILHPVAYYSATFIPAERNYDIYERELLAMMKCYDPGPGSTNFLYPPIIPTPSSVTITLPANIQPTAPVILPSFTTAIPEILITWPTSHTRQHLSMEYFKDPVPVMSDNSNEDSPMRTRSPSLAVEPSSSPAVVILEAHKQPSPPWKAWLSQPRLSRPERRSISPSSEESAPKRLRHDDRSYTPRTPSAQSTAASPNTDSPPMQINLL